MRRHIPKTIALLLIAVLVVTSLTYKQAQASPTDPLDIKAESAMLIDAQSGRILYQKNPDEQMHPASMSKMMTEYLVLEAIKNKKISWDQKISIDDYVYQVSQDRSLSNVPLRKDVEYTVKELYESMAIYSANASTIALAELVAGTEADFVKMMNDKAVELGMKDYNFVNSTGLNNADLKGMEPTGGPDDENVMSARATATLAFRLLKDYPEVLQFASIPNLVFQEGTTDRIEMANWNWMLPGGTMYPIVQYDGVDGLKTGHTELGGYSFTGTAVKNNMRLISVVMKTDSNTELARFYETKKIFDYGFKNYTLKEIFPAGYKISSQETIPVKDGSEETVAIESQKPLVMAVKNGEENQFDPVFELAKTSYVQDGKATAPVEKGQILGYLSANYKGSDNYGYLTGDSGEKIPMVASVKVDKASWIVLLFRSIVEFFTNLFK